MEKTYGVAEWRAEYDRRAAEGICCTMTSCEKPMVDFPYAAAVESYRFPCDRVLSAVTGDSTICARCENEQDTEEGRCDGLAARREDHQADE